MFLSNLSIERPVFATVLMLSLLTLGISSYRRLAIDLYPKLLHEPDPAKQRAVMREFEKHTLDDQAHEILSLWWYRVVPHRSYVKGWKIGPSHFLNQDLATIWLDQ